MLLFEYSGCCNKVIIRFYYGSGLSFSRKVWLALELEHKQPPYDFNVRSLQQGEQPTRESADPDRRRIHPLEFRRDCRVFRSALPGVMGVCQF